MLETKDLSVGYGDVAIVQQLNLQAQAGEIVALLGRNGAGKTTTLSTISGRIPPLRGEVYLDGKAAKTKVHKRARDGLAWLSEERAIIRRLTVWENFRLGLGEPGKALGIFKDLEKLRNKQVGLLSGGEQQMVALARCLAAEPRLLLVDELSFGLAPLIVQQLCTALRVAADSGAAVVVVEQYAHIALRIADRGYVIGRGRVEISGTAAELRDRWSEIEASYLSGSVTPTSENEG